MAQLGHFGPNNFSLSNDSRDTKPSLMSVFKQDYPVHGEYGRSEKAHPPRLGDVMHFDDRVKERASETVTSFIYRPLAKPVLMDVQNTLRATNFKTDRDLSKVDAFATTNDHYYQPKYLPQDNSMAKGNTTHRSHIPQGDPGKADAPLTNYRDKFPGHDPKENPIIKAPSMHHGGDPTIKGDGRLGHYDTSQKNQFQGIWASAPGTLPAPTGTNVPMGDGEKERTAVTTMGSSFVEKKNDDFAPFNWGEVSKQLRQTNFKLRDGHGEWDDYRTIADISYVPKTDAGAAFERVAPKRSRNQSDFPEGDRDPVRDSDRLNETNYRYYMGTPARGIHNKIVSGANLRTKSNVWFGEPPLDDKFYETTTSSVFDPKSVPYSYSRENLMQKSCIPVDYYKNNFHHETTMRKDFPDPQVPRMNPRADGLDRIKTSHVFPPLGAKTHFKTTHNDLFTPKTTEKYTYDTGRMQRSCVPLGTFS